MNELRFLVLENGSDIERSLPRARINLLPFQINADQLLELDPAGLFAGFRKKF